MLLTLIVIKFSAGLPSSIVRIADSIDDAEHYIKEFCKAYTRNPITRWVPIQDREIIQFKVPEEQFDKLEFNDGTDFLVCRN